MTRRPFIWICLARLCVGCFGVMSLLIQVAITDCQDGIDYADVITSVCVAVLLLQTNIHTLIDRNPFLTREPEAERLNANILDAITALTARRKPRACRNRHLFPSLSHCHRHSSRRV